MESTLNKVDLINNQIEIRRYNLSTYHISKEMEKKVIDRIRVRAAFFIPVR